MGEFLLRARVEAEVVETWIAAGWLVPAREAGTRRFSEADLARAQLIRDLSEDLGVNDDGIGVVLDLLDQLHGARRILRTLLACLEEQPEAVRSRVFARVLEVSPGPPGPRRRSAVKRQRPRP